MIKNKINPKKQKGLTLIELLVAITLLGVVMAIATAMILPSYEIYDSSTRRMSAGQLAELAKSEVSGYLRMVLKEEDYQFGKNTDEWNFHGYHPSEGNTIVKYVFKHVDDRLYIEIYDFNSDPIDEYSRVIVNNVDRNSSTSSYEHDGFYIDESGSSNSFELYIRINDGENIAEKKINVRPRNL